MKCLSYNIYWILLFLVVLLACNIHCVSNQVNMPIEKNNEFDPICGDNIIWHIHLQDGFSLDTVRFVVGADTFPDYTLPTPWVIANTANNGCTNIYFTCYKHDGRIKIFLDDMPYFSEIQEIDEIDQNNVHLLVIINGDIIDFKASLDYNHFFGLNYDPKSRGISVWQGTSCFICE